MFGILAHYHQPPVAADNLAISANGFYGSSYLHKGDTKLIRNHAKNANVIARSEQYSASDVAIPKLNSGIAAQRVTSLWLASLRLLASLAMTESLSFSHNSHAFVDSHRFTGFNYTR